MATRYVEIPLDRSVTLIEPILTQNISDDGITRLLVGRVNDPDLGPLSATAYFNYSPPIQPVFPTAGATFQRIELTLKFDYYSYGSTDSTDMLMEVHEILEALTPEQLYYSGRYIEYNPTPLGDTIFAVGPMSLNEGWGFASDTDPENNLYFKQNVKLDPALGQSLLDDLKNDRILIDDFAAFSNKYKGLAVTMPIADKILGFTPVYSLPTPSTDDSRLTLTYKESDGTTVNVDFPIYYASVNNVLNPVVSYTYLEPDRTGTPLDGLAPFTDLVPADGNLYAQSGTGIIPKFELAKVYEYFDTITHAVINSAQLIFDNTFEGRTPQTIELLLLDSTNRFRGIYLDTIVGGVELKVNDLYLYRIQPGIEPYAVNADETRVAIANALSGGTVSVNPITGEVGPTILTEFFQQIVNHKKHPRRAKAFALHPMETEFKKTVSVLKFSPGSARLRIYYSVPLTGIP